MNWLENDVYDDRYADDNGVCPDQGKIACEARPAHLPGDAAEASDWHVQCAIAENAFGRRHG